DQLQASITAGDSLGADNLIVRVYDELCKKELDKLLGKAEKTIQNWKSGLNQYREFIYNYIDENVDVCGQQLPSETIATQTTDGSIKVGDISKATVHDYTRQDVYNNFRFRLITQNRPNSEICFPVSAIKTLFYQNSEKDFFDKWIENQIANTRIITKDKEFKLSEASSISVLEDGTVLFNIKDRSFELYSNTADSKGKFKLSVKTFSQVVLDHIISKREILDTNKEKLPRLCDITKRIYKEDRTVKTGKDLRRVGAILLKKNIINKNDIPELKKELELIGSQIHLQLMDSSENAKKSNTGKLQ
ncbi:MAG: hypothetical protein LBK97_06430, partial [Prevotellaceae bacterium]|nr:hypothetical protein [Prevotellaceae bacterium]